MPRPLASLLLVAMLLTGCGGSSGSPAASPPTGGPATSSPTASSPVTSPTSPLSAAPTPVPSPSPVATPAPNTVFRDLPLRRSAWAGGGPGIGIAPGPDGSVAVSIDRTQGGPVLVVYDAKGKPEPGWPIEVPNSTWCVVHGFATDGSMRAICDATDLPSDERGTMAMRAFAIDPVGRVLDGWPVQLPESWYIGVVGDDLMLVVNRSVGGGEWNGSDPAQVLSRSWLVRVAADGTTATGEALSLTAADCWGVDWVIGPDGIAYGVSESSIPRGACLRDDSERTRESIGPAQLRGLGMAGAEPGWPMSIEGAMSGPSFAADGTILVAVGSYSKSVTRLLAIDPGSRRIIATSAALPVGTASLGLDSDACSTGPSAPMVAADGTVFYEQLGRVWVFNPDLRPLKGWPYESSGYPVTQAPPDFDGLCPGTVHRVVGPDGTLYEPLEPPSARRGGRLDAIGKDGKRLAGWPVKLSRAGAKFWNVAVGEDGTIYALAVEPEGKRKASATLLAIDPDSEVRYAVTLLEP
jgi:hypothetical protein